MFRYIIIGILLIAFGFTSCVKPEQLSEIPKIELLSFELLDTIDALDNVGKYGILEFSFVDGDGDLGLEQIDTSASYALGEKYYNNLFVNILEMQEGTFVKIPNDSIDLFYRFIYFGNEEAQNKTLKGRMKIFLSPIYSGYNFDTIQYQLYIADRAMHESNVIVTDTVIIETY